MTTGQAIAIDQRRFQRIAAPRPKTASGGLRPIPHRRLSRWRLQGTDASGKMRSRYDWARRGAVLPQSEENEGCKILRSNSESTQGVLPAYLTGNDNWNDASTLQGYQNYYQSNGNQWQLLTSTTAKVIIGMGSALAGATPIGRAASIPLRVGSVSARYGAAGVGSVGLNSFIARQLKLNQDRVNALQQRLNYLKSGC